MKTMIIATAALLSLQFTVHSTPAQAEISSNPVLAAVDGVAVFAWAIYGTMGSPAQITFATKPLFDQRRVLLTELEKIPATQQVKDLTAKMSNLDLKIESIINDFRISRADAMKEIEPLSSTRHQLSLERAKVLKSALSQVPSEVLQMTDESLRALKSSHLAKSEALTNQIRQMEKRYIYRRHLPIMVGGAVIFLGALVRGESPSEMIINAISSLSQSDSDALADSLVSDLKAQEAK